MRSLSLAAILSFACACSSADPSLEESDSNPVDPNETTLDPSVEGSDSADQPLQELEFEDLKLSFYWVGSEEADSADGTIAIAENFRADYLGALRAEYGPVTSLEIFNAFAAEGMEPHPRLVARHEPEAIAFGRTGASLDVLDVDGHALDREKAIPANCQSTILPNISPGSYTEIQSTDVGVDGLWVHTCTASPKVSGVQLSVTATPQFVRCESLPATRLLTVGLCNDSTSLNSVEFFTEIHTPPVGVTAPRGTVSPGFIGRFSYQPDPSPTAPARGAAVLSRNNAANSVNFHRQITGVGVF